MRLSEILLTETVTFGVARLSDHNGQQVYSDPFMKKEMGKCWVCHGTGKEEFGGYTDNNGVEQPTTEHTCDYCHGEGKIEEWKTSATELNVSNSNAMEIQRMLGLDADYSGVIKQKDFPLVKRKLIRLKNGDISAHTELPNTSGGQMKKYKDDRGVTAIGRTATMHDAGRSHSQVERYIDTLLSLIDFAQKSNCDVVWG